MTSRHLADARIFPGKEIIAPLKASHPSHNSSVRKTAWHWLNKADVTHLIDCLSSNTPGLLQYGVEGLASFWDKFKNVCCYPLQGG
jgi:hypothetical protein